MCKAEKKTAKLLISIDSNWNSSWFYSFWNNKKTQTNYSAKLRAIANDSTSAAAMIYSCWHLNLSNKQFSTELSNFLADLHLCCGQCSTSSLQCLQLDSLFCRVDTSAEVIHNNTLQRKFVFTIFLDSFEQQSPLDIWAEKRNSSNGKSSMENSKEFSQRGKEGNLWISKNSYKILTIK